MKYRIVIGSLFAFVMLVGCSRGYEIIPMPPSPTPTPAPLHMTVAEYAEWCGDQVNRTYVPKTWGGVNDDFWWRLDEFKGLNPPWAVRDFHAQYIEIYTFLYEITKYITKYGTRYDSYNGSELNRDPRVWIVGVPLSERFVELPENVQHELSRTGCYDERNEVRRTS